MTFFDLTACLDLLVCGKLEVFVLLTKGDPLLCVRTNAESQSFPVLWSLLCPQDISEDDRDGNDDLKVTQKKDEYAGEKLVSVG